MQRSHTLLFALTLSAACGSGPSGPKAAPIGEGPVPPPAPGMPRAAVVKPLSAPPVAPDLPKLSCPAGTSVAAAPALEPMWFCVRSDGVKDGPFFRLFPTNAIEIEGSYKNGKLDGPWKRHYPGGALAEEGAYASGLVDGPWRQLGPTGNVLGEYKVKAGTGKIKRWLDDGPLYSETSVYKGVRNGPMRIFDRSGIVVVAAKYLYGRLDDKHLVGGKGTLRIEEEFVRGVRKGARQIWQFGVLVVDEIYDDKGKLDGSFTIWRDKNIPRVQGMYEHGKRIGSWIWTDKNNKKEREGDYLDGKKSGLWSEWTDEKLTYQGMFTDGRPDGDHVYFDAKTGNELGRFKMNDGSGTMITFHPNKKPATKTQLYKGAMEGKYEELTPLGKTTVEGRYVNDRKHGLWREQTPTGVATLEQTWRRGKLDGKVKKLIDGKVAVEATYKDGKAEGPYTELRDGTPSLTGQFKADRRDGTWTELDANGAVRLTVTYKDGVLDGPYKHVVDGVILAGEMKAGRRAGTWTQTDRAGKTYTVTYKTP